MPGLTPPKSLCLCLLDSELAFPLDHKILLLHLHLKQPLIEVLANMIMPLIRGTFSALLKSSAKEHVTKCIPSILTESGAQGP